MTQTTDPREIHQRAMAQTESIVAAVAADQLPLPTPCFEYDVRELLSLGWPRVRRFHWSQIDRVFVPSFQGAREAKTIRLDLWDGTRTWLPDVAKASELGMMLERVALARAIPIEGGTGLVDDLGNPLGD